MRAFWIGLLLLLIAGAAFGPGLWTPPRPSGPELVILSPHWDGIREEFGRAFEEHWKKSTGRSVRVAWRDIGGTGEIRRYIRERARQTKWDEGQGIGADVLFGGGTYIYGPFARDGILAPYTPSAVRRGEVPAEVNGQRLRGAGGRWHAACLSGFGIIYNQWVIEKAKLPAPKSWADLARPAYRGWVSCGDPTSSGSVHMAFEIILQAYGWKQGWGVLARLAANVTAFNEGGGSVPRDVALGQAAAGPCIDFYAAAPVRRQGATFLKFVFPKGLSVITPDAIALFRNAPHPKLARGFVDFVLSEQGQRLWYQKRGSPGGPKKFDLERLPVWPSLYEKKLPTYTVARPFERGQAARYDGRKGGRRWVMLEYLWSAVLIDVHEDLKAAWKAVIAARRVEDLGAALGRPPLSERELLALASKKRSPGENNRLRRRWTGWARAHYRAIRKAAQSGGAPPEAADGGEHPDGP